jgi:hypothetical protein
MMVRGAIERREDCDFIQRTRRVRAARAYDEQTVKTR